MSIPKWAVLVVEYVYEFFGSLFNFTLWFVDTLIFMSLCLCLKLIN